MPDLESEIIKRKGKRSDPVIYHMPGMKTENS